MLLQRSLIAIPLALFLVVGCGSADDSEESETTTTAIRTTSPTQGGSNGDQTRSTVPVEDPTPGDAVKVPQFQPEAPSPELDQENPANQ